MNMCVYIYLYVYVCKCLFCLFVFPIFFVTMVLLYFVRSMRRYVIGITTLFQILAVVNILIHVSSFRTTHRFHQRHDSLRTKGNLTLVTANFAGGTFWESRRFICKLTAGIPRMRGLPSLMSFRDSLVTAIDGSHQPSRIETE